jgi:hypothetical protein
MVFIGFWTVVICRRRRRVTSSAGGQYVKCLNAVLTVPGLPSSPEMLMSGSGREGCSPPAPRALSAPGLGFSSSTRAVTHSILQLVT